MNGWNQGGRLRLHRVLRFGALVLTLLLALATPALAQGYAVTRVVDGDTIVLDAIGTVRLIGIDTPETVDPRKPVQAFGVEASAALRSMLDAQRVRVAYDQQRHDKYGRTLAYVYLPDGTFVNREMVRRGYAHAYLNYPFRHMDDFRAAEREAREASRGLWGDAPFQAAAPASASSRVWVNSSSRVYHCPGTRYYGSTARGEYITEADAIAQGHRPAYGRTCSVPDAPMPPSASTSPRNVAPPTAAEPATSTAITNVRVWVNTSSKVYHCPGTRYFGTTKAGVYMTESEAESAGHRPSGGRRCS